MTDDTWLNPQKGPTTDELAFDYLKGPDFRVIWTDGIIGSLTPNGHVHFAMYAERPALPRRQVFKIGPAGDLGPEVTEKLISRGSVVREMSCDVFMTPQLAEQVANWLLEKVAEHKKQQRKKNGS
jgi:hypothetical protein